MHFTLKQMKYFDAALRVGSIARAASEMNISQSSITAAVDAIEQSVGGELFRRVPAKGLQPTERGREVGARIAEFLEQARVLESDLMSMSGDPAGILRMGCYAPTAPYVLPRLMKSVAQLHPGIRVDLVEDDMSKMVELLHSGAIDIALTYRRNVPDGLPFLPMFSARPWAVLPDTHPLAAQSVVSLEELSAQPIVMLELPTTASYFRRIFADHGLPLNVAHTTKSSAVLRGLVAAGFGCSILNICSPVDREGKSGYVARPISGDLDSPNFGAAYTQASRRSAIVQAVLEVCTELGQGNEFEALILSPTP